MRSVMVPGPAIVVVARVPKKDTSIALAVPVLTVGAVMVVLLALACPTFAEMGVVRSTPR